MLKGAYEAYRQLLILEKSMLPGAESFTPRQLARQIEKSGLKNTELNTVSQAMTQTLPNQIPNSGTAERLMANVLPGVLMGGGVGANELGYPTVGAGLLATGAMGTKTGSKFMLGRLPGQQSQTAALVAELLRWGVPAATRPGYKPSPSKLLQNKIRGSK